MADQGSSQWRGKGQSGVSRVNPTGVTSSGKEGSFAPLASDGPYKTVQGSSTVRVPDPFTLSATSAVVQVGNSTVRVPDPLTVSATKAVVQAGNSASRSATPRTMRAVYVAVTTGSSSESYTIFRTVV